MLLPDNIHPEFSIYFNGSIILMELKMDPKQKMLDLYEKVKKRNDMSFTIFMLSLDWLYLIDATKINDNGWIELCS